MARVVVVGAGMSGLTCARHLARAGIEVVVLEARDRLGGRTHTVEAGLPHPVDAGGSFVHGVRGNPLVPLAHEFGISLGVLEHMASVYDVERGQLPDDEANLSASTASKRRSLASSQRGVRRDHRGHRRASSARSDGARA